MFPNYHFLQANRATFKPLTSLTCTLNWYRGKHSNIKTITYFPSTTLFDKIWCQVEWKFELEKKTSKFVWHCISNWCNLSLIVLFPCRYYYLAFRAHQMPEGSKENAVIILERAKLEHWVLGKTKVELSSSSWNMFFIFCAFSFSLCPLVVNR